MNPAQNHNLPQSHSIPRVCLLSALICVASCAAVIFFDRTVLSSPGRLLIMAVVLVGVPVGLAVVLLRKQSQTDSK